MTKIMKKIMLVVCSFLFVCCLGTGAIFGLNTDKKIEAKAATEPTVELTGFGTHNNTAWNDSFDAVDLAFSGEFTAATQALTSGSITYTTPGGSAANFQYYWANINGCGANVVELLCWKGAMTEGTVLNVAGGTVIGGQTLPELTFVLKNGAWTNEPTVEFTGFGTLNNGAWGDGDKFDAVDLVFSGEFTANTQALTSGSITYTKPGETAANFQYYWANINGCGTNVVELLCWKGAMTEGTVLNVAGGTVLGGQILPELTFTLTDGVWVKTEVEEKTTANFVGIYSDGTTTYNMVEAPTKPGRYIIALEYDQVLNAEATASLTLSDVSVTLDGKATENFLIRNSNNITNTKIVEVLFNTWTTSGTSYTSDGSITSSNMPVGTKLEVSGSANGYTLETVTLYYNGTNWQDTVPTTPETPDESETPAETATFTGIVEDYNFNPYYSGRYALLLGFDKPMATEVASTLITGSNVLDITLNGKAVTIGGDTLLPRCMKVVTDNANVIELVFFNYDTTGTVYAEGVTSPFAHGTVLKVGGEGNVVNGYSIPEITLYFNATAKQWSEEEVGEPTPEEITFVKIDENINHYDNGSGYYLTDLKFSFDTTQNMFYTNFGTPEEGYEDLGSKIYWTANGDTTKHSFNIVFGINGNIRLMDAAENFPTAYATIHIEEGTVIEGKELPAVTLYVKEDGTWTTEEQVAPEEITFVKIDENINYYTDGSGYYLTDLKFSFDTTQNMFYINFGTPEEGYEDLGSKIYWTANGDTTKHSFNIVFGINGNIRLMDAAANFPTAYATIHIEEGTVIEGKELPAVTLYVKEDGTWTTEEQVAPEPEPEEITFVKIDENINYYTDGSGYYLTDLKFSFDTTQDKFYIYFGTPQEGYEDLGEKIYWTANGDTTKHSFNIVFGVNGNIRLMDAEANFPTAYATIHIEEGTVIEGKELPAVTLYVKEDGTWTTEEQVAPEPEPVETANFERVVGCVMDGSQWGMHSILYVKFDRALAPNTPSIQGTGTANNSGNLKDKMTLGGNPISMGSQINFYLNTFYPTEGANTTILEIMFVKATASDYAKGTVLHIPEGTLFGEVALSEVTLTFNGATWIDETSLTRVEFVEMDANRNNNNVWGMNYVTILYFDAPLYESAMDTALAEQIAGDLGVNLTINGVTAKELGVAITFASLSQEGRYGLEIHVPVDNMPAFSQELSQIVLEIKEDTIFLNNILPALKFYLNGESKWQADEFIYVYVPPQEVEFSGVNFRYNNDENTWQSEGEWYLTVFEFSDYLSKTEMKGSALPLGDKITLNGVKTSELGFLYGIGAYSSTMNVQYPKEALLSLLDEPRIELALTEPVEYGDSIIQPFRLYLHKQSIKWELIDETDKVAPEISYSGATEIETTAEKPFVISVSAFDKEDNKEAVIYYVWSEGAFDADGKLVKGTHTCAVVAVDKSGNESKIDLTVTVGDKDEVAPVIAVAEQITGVAGAIPQLTYQATDDTDGEILCEVSWSEGALDEEGKLVAGTHTLTLTATDLTGNTTTKEVTVTVVDVPTEDFEDEDSSSEGDIPSSEETDDGKGSSKGCKGSVGGCAMAIALATACAYALKKRKE